MDKNAKIYVAGHTGLVGSALLRALRQAGQQNIITASHEELDLLDQAAVRAFFERTRPEYVFMAAGRTGGIYANDTYRAEFIYENILIQTNLIHQSFLSAVRRLIYFGCSSMYPRFCEQPMKESMLLSGALEPTNEPFAVAKLAGTRMCEAYNRQYGTEFIPVIPTNLYGPNQNYTPLNCLVVPALIRRFHEAKVAAAPEVSIWGSGRPARDVLYVDDLADAALHVMTHSTDCEPINIATGHDITIAEMARVVSEAVGYQGRIAWDSSRPEGVLVKLQDVSRITALGWKPRTDFESGVRASYQDFLDNHAQEVN